MQGQFVRKYLNILIRELKKKCLDFYKTQTICTFSTMHSKFRRVKLNKNMIRKINIIRRDQRNQMSYRTLYNVTSMQRFFHYRTNPSSPKTIFRHSKYLRIFQPIKHKQIIAHMSAAINQSIS